MEKSQNVEIKSAFTPSYKANHYFFFLLKDINFIKKKIKALHLEPKRTQ